MDHIDELASAFSRFPGIGPRQGKRFVYYLLSVLPSERTKLSELILSLGKNVKQCPECMRFHNGNSHAICNYCSDTKMRDDSQLLIVEKDQDLAAIERAGSYKGRYFVLGGVLTLSGKGVIREKELLRTIEKRLSDQHEVSIKLQEVVLALSATSEGEHTVDHIRGLLAPWRDKIKISELGRGLATGSELEYSDAETLRAALSNRKEM